MTNEEVSCVVWRQSAVARWLTRRIEGGSDLLAGARDLSIPPGLRRSWLRNGRVRALAAYRVRKEKSTKDAEATAASLRSLPLLVRPRSVEVITREPIEVSGGGYCDDAYDPDQPVRQAQVFLRSRSAFGTGVEANREVRGGKGEMAQVVDVEGDWWLGHPDFGCIKVHYWRGPRPDDVSHGTAILGILGATGKNTAGAEGMVPRASIGVVQVDEDPCSTWERLLELADNLPPASVVLLPIKFKKNRVPALPFEALEIGRDIARLLGKRKIYLIESAGNGRKNLNEHIRSRFLKSWVHSGAILVGAGEPKVGKRCGDSNYGRRVDLHNWGRCVVTCDSSGDYNYGFTGTSAAGAIVAGVVACIASVLAANGYRPLSPRRMRRLLVRTGYLRSEGIGPRPDVEAALTRLRRQGYRFAAREGDQAGD